MNSNRYHKVDGHPNIVRDLMTNAILNTNFNEMQSYISSKEKRLLEKKKIEYLESNIESLKSSIDEIKQLLRNLTNESR